MLKKSYEGLTHFFESKLIFILPCTLKKHSTLSEFTIWESLLLMGSKSFSLVIFIHSTWLIDYLVFHKISPSSLFTEQTNAKSTSEAGALPNRIPQGLLIKHTPCCL